MLLAALSNTSIAFRRWVLHSLPAASSRFVVVFALSLLYCSRIIASTIYAFRYLTFCLLHAIVVAVVVTSLFLLSSAVSAVVSRTGVCVMML